MQISRHWRLKSQRYRLSGTAINKEGSLIPIGLQNRYESEIVQHDKRHVGVLTIFHDPSKEWVWMFEDESKFEGAGTWYRRDDGPQKSKPLGFPGGGKQGNESRWGTAVREFLEEMGYDHDQQNVLRGWVARLPHQVLKNNPCAINQMYPDENGKVQKINQVVFVTETVEVKPTDWISTELNKKGQWVRTQEVSRHLNGFFGQQTDLESMRQFRPQAILAAGMLTGELLDEQIDDLNKFTVGWAYDVCEDVHNGILNTNGKLMDNLTWDQRRYLNVS